MSADFIISAMKEAKDKIIAQHARIDELLQKTQQLERDNAALREALIITTERLSHYVRVPVPVAPGLYATSAEEKASLEVIVKAEEILYPKAKP